MHGTRPHVHGHFGGQIPSWALFFGWMDGTQLTHYDTFCNAYSFYTVRSELLATDDNERKLKSRGSGKDVRKFELQRIITPDSTRTTRNRGTESKAQGPKASPIHPQPIEKTRMAGAPPDKLGSRGILYALVSISGPKRIDVGGVRASTFTASPIYLQRHRSEFHGLSHYPSNRPCIIIQPKPWVVLPIQLL